MKKHPPDRLRRMHGLAALARHPLAWPRWFHGLQAVPSTVGN